MKPYSRNDIAFALTYWTVALALAPIWGASLIMRSAAERLR